eukprot:superscaffoldBa00003736_g17585
MDRKKNSSSDVQQLLESKEEVLPEQQEGSSSLDQDDPEPPHIKEEQEEFWTSQEGEQLPGLEEADIIRFTYIPVPHEDNEEKPQSSQLHQRQTPASRATEQMETEADGENCGVPARNLVLHRASPSDVRKVIVGEDEQAECSSDLDQEDPDPPQIKEEQEELWLSQEGEQLQRLEEADITDFIFTPVPVKSEDDEEKPQSSQLHQRQTEEMKTEVYGEDCGGSELAKNSHPERHLLQATDNKTLDSPDTEAEDGDDDWMETRQPQSGEKRYCCRVCDQRFIWYSQVKNHKCVGGSSHYQRQTEENRESELQGLEEVDIIKFTFSPVPVKSEDDEERPQSSQLHQSQKEQVKTEADGVDPNRHLQPDTDVKTEDCPDFKVEISDNDKKETGGEPQSGLNRPKNDKDPAMFPDALQLLESKEEQEELWTSQGGEQLQGLEEADITEFTCTPVPVKSEDNEEKPQSSQLHQRQTEQMEPEADGEDCGGSEPARNSHPHRHLQPDTGDKTSDSSEPEDNDNDDDEGCKETSEPQTGLNLLHDEVPKLISWFPPDVRFHVLNPLSFVKVNCSTERTDERRGWDIDTNQPLKLLSLLIGPEFLLFLFNVWGLWVLLVQTGTPPLLLRGNLFFTLQQLLDICRKQETNEMLKRKRSECELGCIGLLQPLKLLSLLTGPRNRSECELGDISLLQPLELLSFLTAPEFLLFLFNVWGLWVLLVQTGAPLLLLRGNLFFTLQQLLDVCRKQETNQT